MDSTLLYSVSRAFVLNSPWSFGNKKRILAKNLQVLTVPKKECMHKHEELDNLCTGRIFYFVEVLKKISYLSTTCG